MSTVHFTVTGEFITDIKLAYALRSKQCRNVERFGSGGDKEFTPYQLNNLEPLMWDKHLKAD